MRPLLLAAPLLAALMPAAQAQTAGTGATGPMALSPAIPALQPERPASRPAPPRRPAPRTNPSDRAFMGGGMVMEAPFAQQAARSDPRGDRAPMPNVNIEAPRSLPTPFDSDQVRVTPGFISPRIPGRGATAQDNTMGNRLEERLFKPAPGAHLRMPMTW